MEDYVQMWGDIAARHEKEWKETWGNNDTTGPLVYRRDVVPYKQIVRAVRLKADQPICWGAADCLDQTLSHCAAGKHETCKQHANDCFLCKAEAESA
jgi:hypothetical protein